MGSSTEVDAAPFHAWLTAVKLSSGAETQIVCDGTLWIQNHSTFSEAIDYAVAHGFISAAEGLGISHYAGPSVWTTKIEVEAKRLRLLGFRVGGLSPEA